MAPNLEEVFGEMLIGFLSGRPVPVAVIVFSICRTYLGTLGYLN